MGEEREAFIFSAPLNARVMVTPHINFFTVSLVSFSFNKTFVLFFMEFLSAFFLIVVSFDSASDVIVFVNDDDSFDIEVSPLLKFCSSRDDLDIDPEDSVEAV